MITLVLAGGHATRLWPLTREHPKPLLPLGESTILDHLLDDLQPAVDGRIVVGTNAKFADAFRDWQERTGRHVEIEVEAQASEAEKPGALAAIVEFVRAMPEPDDLVVIAGDNVLGFDMVEFVQSARARRGPTVACIDVKEPERATQFGVVEPGSGDEVMAFHEKPADPPSTLAATAAYYYPAPSLELFERYVKATAGTPGALDAPGRILEWAAANAGPVHFSAYDAAWFDVGSLGGYLDAQTHVAGRIVDADVTDCELGDRVFLYDGATIRNSRLEDAIVLPGARIVDSTLQRAVVDTNAQLESVELVDSIVGAHCKLKGPGSP